jgi:hypothetical protein
LPPISANRGSLLADHPHTLTDALAAGGGEAKRAFAAMMTMKKIDIAAIDERGES